jgi:hypothetical protein
MSPPLVAFGFAHLPMLGWLAAAAAPIVIHLWSRQKYREMSWAAMEYLLAAVRRKTRRLRLEQWLLLAVRTLLIVLLVLATAEPFLQSAGSAFTVAVRTHRMLVIDGSYSMAYRAAEQSRFERAKQFARRIVEESSQGDAFTLVLLASPPRVIVGTPALEPAEVLREIDNLQLLQTTIDLPSTLGVIERLLAAARREAPHLDAQEVYFLTDLQRVGWLPGLSGAALAEFRRRSAALAEAASLVVFDVGQPAAENLAVTEVRALEPVVTAGQDVGLEAVLKNFGRQSRSRQPVEWLVDGRRVGQQAVDVAPGGEAAAAFSYRFETPGEHAVEVRADGDALELDNHRFLAIPVRESLRVLCINGRPSGEPFRGATDYLVYALSPQGDADQRALVQAEAAPESALLERDDLGRYDCLFLCEVAQLTASEAQRLDNYLKNGGSLVFFLGEGVQAERYNRELGGGAGGVRLLPARLAAVVTAPPDCQLDALEFQHPLVQAFRGRGRAALRMTPVFKYFKLELPRNSRAKVALALTGGDPLIVEEPIRRGRVVLVATAAADKSWNLLPVSPSFVPLVQELLAYCLSGQLRQRNVLVGEPLGASIPASAGDAPVTVQSPDGRSRPVPPRLEGDQSTWSYSDTALSGVYTARFGPPLGRSQSFAVNVDTAESDLTPLSADQLRREVWPGVPLRYQTTWENAERQSLRGPIGRGGRLPAEMLCVVLGLLLLETFLAWRFGHHAR